MLFASSDFVRNLSQILKSIDVEGEFFCTNKLVLLENLWQI
jgi:hypothetical protein